MIRLLAIAFLLALAFVLIRYRTNEKLQKWVIIGLVSAFVMYTITLIVTELTR